MFITVTTSRPKQDQIEKVETFLSKFLPRLEQQPGVVAIYHYLRQEQGDDATLIVWEDQEAMKSYRDSSLFKEASTFEKELNLPSARVGYQLAYATAKKV